jgi:hypothetical protein
MSTRLRIILLLGVATIGFLSRRELLRLIVAWGEALNRLLQTDLDTYPVEDPSWTIVERPTTSAERRALRLERTKRHLNDPTGTPMPFGAIWNWVRRSPVRRAIHRNRRDAVHRTAS